MSQRLKRLTVKEAQAKIKEFENVLVDVTTVSLRKFENVLVDECLDLVQLKYPDGTHLGFLSNDVLKDIRRAKQK